MDQLSLSPIHPPAISYRPFALQKVRYFCYSSHSRASSWPRSHPPDFSFQTYLSETLVYPSPRIIRRISSRQQREKLRPSLFTILETAILLLPPSSQIPLTFQPRFPRSFKTSHISRIPPYSTAENSPILSLSNVPFEKNIDVEGEKTSEADNVRPVSGTMGPRTDGSSTTRQKGEEEGRRKGVGWRRLERKPAALIRGNFWRRRQRASAAFDDKTRVALVGRGQRVSLRGLRESRVFVRLLTAVRLIRRCNT